MTTTKNNEHKKLNFSSEREQSQVCLNSAEHEKNQGRKVLNVPNLRFPEFQGEWKKCILGDITENFNLRNKDKIQYLMFSVTNDRGFVPQSEQFEGRDMVGEDIKAYKIIHTNDFAYNPARINVGSIAMYTGEKPCMISSLYVCFKTTKEVNNEWLMQLLKTPKMNYYYNVNGEGGVRVYLFYPNFARIRMSIPKIEEQKKIARLLNLIDERIATQNKIIDKLQSLIKGLRVRLIQIENGNIVHLGEIAQIYQPQTISSTELTEDGFLVYGANGIIGKYKDYNHKTEQICITCRGNTCGMVNYTKPMSWITGNAMVINTDEHPNKVCKRYLYHYLSAYNFNSIISGSGQPQIVRTPLEKLEITLPSIFEQEQKVMLLDRIQAKIEISNRVLSLYQGQKQYLLRQMFI